MLQCFSMAQTHGMHLPSWTASETPSLLLYIKVMSTSYINFGTKSALGGCSWAMPIFNTLSVLVGFSSPYPSLQNPSLTGRIPGDLSSQSVPRQETSGCVFFSI